MTGPGRAQRHYDLGALRAWAMCLTNLVEGGLVRRGELILAIDEFDYRAALKEAESRLGEARGILRCVAARRGRSFLDMAIARSNEARYYMTSFMTT